MWKIWLIFAGIFMICEMATTGFCIFWLSIGSLIAMVVSLFIPNIIFQTTVFVISSTLLIFATKPFVNKFANNKEKIPTNVYSLKGKKAIVIEDIIPSDGKGLIKVNGETWSAVCDVSQTISKGSEVEIDRIEGVKTYVKLINAPINK